MTPFPLDLWLQTFPSRQGAQALEGPRSPHKGRGSPLCSLASHASLHRAPCSAGRTAAEC